MAPKPARKQVLAQADSRSVRSKHNQETYEQLYQQLDDENETSAGEESPMDSPQLDTVKQQPPIVEEESTDEPAAQDDVLTATRSDDLGVANEVHTGRRVRSAAATLGGTAGVIMSGPVAGVALAAAAAYATTRENTAGRVVRKTSAAYLQVTDVAVDKAFEAADRGLQEGRKELAKQLQSVDPAKVPAPLRSSFRQVARGLEPADPALGVAGIEEARKMREKYPDRIPVYCEPSSHSSLPSISKKKFAVPGPMLCGEFKYMVHKLLTQSMPGNSTRAEQTIYIFVNGIAPKTSTPMSELYAQMGPSGGFLHVIYSAENTLG